MIETSLGRANPTKSRHVRRAFTRVAVAATVGVASATMLSGCFLVPLLDNRSPFDDPSGASRAQIGEAVPLVQAALDDSVPPDPAWRVTAGTGSDNCEGACDLRVEVSIIPADTSSLTPIERTDVIDNSFPRYSVPEDVLRAALVAAIPVAESQQVDVTFVPGLGEPVDDVAPLADLSAAVESLLGAKGDGPGYRIGYGEFSEGDVRAFTRTHSDVLASMGLD